MYKDMSLTAGQSRRGRHGDAPAARTGNLNIREAETDRSSEPGTSRLSCSSDDASHGGPGSDCDSESLRLVTDHQRPASEARVSGVTTQVTVTVYPQANHDLRVETKSGNSNSWVD